MTVNEAVRTGSTYNPADFIGTIKVTDAWRDKITSLAKTQAKEVADWLKAGKSLLTGKGALMMQRQAEEHTDLFRQFKVDNGGRWNGRVTNHSLADIEYRMANGNTSLKLDKWGKAFRETFLPEWNNVLESNGVNPHDHTLI